MIQQIKNKKVLITGGLGFIGSNIAHQCVREGAEVTLIDACIEPYGWNHYNIRGIENAVHFIKGDVRDKTLMEAEVPKADIVFHMAAQVGREISMEDPYLDTDINCMGTLNILEVARQLETSPVILFAGSRGQVGEPEYFPVDEKHPDNPTDIYGINKLAAEKYLLLYHHVYDLPVVSLRLNNVYGPRCQMHAGFYGILNWFMSNAIQDKPITVYGEGSQTRDYVYVDDVVDAFLRCVVEPKCFGQMFYVGSGVETVFIDMVKEIVRVVGKGEIVHVPFPESREKIDIKRFVVDTEKLFETTQWEATIDLVTGIKNTWLYYHENISSYLRP